MCLSLLSSGEKKKKKKKNCNNYYRYQSNGKVHRAVIITDVHSVQFENPRKLGSAQLAKIV